MEHEDKEFAFGADQDKFDFEKSRFVIPEGRPSGVAAADEGEVSSSDGEAQLDQDTGRRWAHKPKGGKVHFIQASGGLTTSCGRT